VNLASRRFVLVALAVLVIAGGVLYAVLSRTPVPAARLPNILLISIDTLRADHLGCYGYARATSPTIDALAARGVLFEQAYSHSPKTAMSHMSIFTGLLPEAHGVEQWNPDGSPRLSDDIPTLATLLKPYGYATFAQTGGGHVRAEIGFDQGMDRYEHGEEVVGIFGKLGEAIAAHVVATPERPFFAFGHTYEVHDPYVPRVPYRTLFTDPGYEGRIVSSYEDLSAAAGKEWQSQHDYYWKQVDANDPRDVQHLRDLFDGSIRLTDDTLGKLIDGLRIAGVLDQTLIIVLSDHGEEFLEHGMFLHEQVYQELLHVPLIMVFPATAGGAALQGRRDGAVVRLIDVLPTVLDYLGIPIPPHVQGTSLLPLLRGGVAPPAVVASSWREGGWDALRVDGDKFLRLRVDGQATRRELYSLTEDPREQRDVAASEERLASQLEARMDALAATGRTYLAHQRQGREVVPDAETLERLRALGYQP
jgi:arylsulfatase A-like enzyme